MGAESTFDIKIRSTADTSGVQQMDAALQRGAGVLNQQVAPAHDKVAGSSKNMGNAVLQASRGLQDMQYGLGGAVNNLEGIASALGLGAGVAGAVTLVAVAVQTLGPVVVEWFKSLDTEGKKLDELKAKLQAGAAAILGEWTPATQAAKDEADKFTDSIKAQADAFSVLDKAQQASLDILKQRQSVDAEIAKTKEENDIADIKAKNLPKDEEARAIAAVKLERAKADKQRELEGMQGEQTIASAAVGNATQEAAQAGARQKQLADEKQRILLQATLKQEIGGTKDKDGNTVTKGSVERVKEAEEAAAAARAQAQQARLGGADEASVQAMIRDAEAKAAQERQRHDDLTKESRDNIAANGGDQFRDIETIDKELGQAGTAAEAAKKKQATAEFDKNKLDAIQFEKKRKIENDYTQAQNKAVGGINADPDAPKRVTRGPLDPFDQAEREQAAQARKPRRDLVAEEAAGVGRKGGGRDLVAEETKRAAESNKAANEATLAALKQMQADNKKLTEQLKNSRS